MRNEPQRARDEFLKTGFQFFCLFFSSPATPPPFMTGWQVELGAKDVQGSARLSKCLLNNAAVPTEKQGGEKNKSLSHLTPPITTAGFRDLGLVHTCSTRVLLKNAFFLASVYLHPHAATLQTNRWQYNLEAYGHAGRVAICVD